VYERFIEHNRARNHSEAIDDVIANERYVDATMKTTFDQLGIDYVDTLPALQEAAVSQAIYPPNVNSHPNRHGYEVIATTVEGSLSGRN
jgi:hypothetical protein